MSDIYYRPIAKSEKSSLGILYYELRMLHYVLRAKPRDDVENSARLEAFLMHARNLIDFL